MAAGCCWCWRICTGSTRSRTICWSSVARAIFDLPVLIVLAYRPPELLRLQAPRIEALGALYARRTGTADRCRGGAGHPRQAGAAAARTQGRRHAALIARITAKAQGNPFYVEELLNYLRDRGIDPQDTAAIDALDLPSSLHTLILSRIDQLSARQQAELKVASVIGRLFRFAHLHGAYPVLGAAGRCGRPGRAGAAGADAAGYARAGAGLPVQAYCDPGGGLRKPDRPGARQLCTSNWRPTWSSLPAMIPSGISICWPSTTTAATTWPRSATICGGRAKRRRRASPTRRRSTT